MQAPSPLGRLIELVTSGPTDVSKLSRAADLSRTTIENIRDGESVRPHSSTMEKIDRACGMPEGTCQRVWAGDLEPEEAAELYGTVNHEGRNDTDRVAVLEDELWEVRLMVTALRREVREQAERHRRQFDALERIAGQIDGARREPPAGPGGR